MTKLEEEAIVQKVLEQSSRGIAPLKACVRDMADKLLGERGEKPVGKNYVDRLIHRTPELKTRWSRPYDRQRAACEDPVVIRPWFALVQAFKEKHGFVNDNIWNFDESGFMMGRIGS